MRGGYVYLQSWNVSVSALQDFLLDRGLGGRYLPGSGPPEYGNVYIAAMCGLRAIRSHRYSGEDLEFDAAPRIEDLPMFGGGLRNWEGLARRFPLFSAKAPGPNYRCLREGRPISGGGYYRYPGEGLPISGGGELAVYRYPREDTCRKLLVYNAFWLHNLLF